MTAEQANCEEQVTISANLNYCNNRFQPVVTHSLRGYASHMVILNLFETRIMMGILTAMRNTRLASVAIRSAMVSFQLMQSSCG